MAQRNGIELIKPPEYREALVAQVFEPLGIGEDFPNFLQEYPSSAGPKFDEEVDRLADADPDETESLEDRWVIRKREIGNVTVKVLRNGPVYYLGNHHEGRAKRTDERLTADRRFTITMPFRDLTMDLPATQTTQVTSVGKSQVRVYGRREIEFNLPKEASDLDHQPEQIYSTGYLNVLEDGNKTHKHTQLPYEKRERRGWQKKHDRTMGLCIATAVMRALKPEDLTAQEPPTEKLYFMDVW